MNSMVRQKRLIIFILTVLLAGFYASFITADMLTGSSDNAYSRSIKYVCILLCLFMALIIGKEGHDRQDTIALQIALALTAVGDFFLGILEIFEPGIAAFFLVQLTYIFRFRRQFRFSKMEIGSGLFFLLLLVSILYFLIPQYQKAGILVPGIIYSVTLMTSLWMGIGNIWRRFYPMSINVIIAIGMICFFMCDINVGLYKTLSSDGMRQFYSLIPIEGVSLVESGPQYLKPVTVAIPFTIRSIIGILVWFFYLPAQVLLVLSGYRLDFLRSLFPLIPVLPEPEMPRV